MSVLVLVALALLMASPAAAQGATPPPDVPRLTALSEGLVVTGHVLPVDREGRLAGTDVASQTKQALANLDVLLKSGGSSLARAASVHVQLRSAGDFAAMNAAYAPMFPADPPARTTIVAEPALAGALVQVSAVGVKAGAPRDVVHPKAWPKSPNPYSYAIKSGDTLFMAGLVARRGQDNAIVEGDVAAQTEVVLQNAQAILEAAGMGFADVVSSRVFIADTSFFQPMNEAYRGRFPEPRPVRATVVCSLMNPAFKVEITLTAVQQPKQLVVPPKEDGSPGTAGPNFSPALRVGGRVYLAGLMSYTPATRDDMRAQTAAVMASATRLLKQAGASIAEVAEAIVYVTDMRRAADARQAVRDALGRDDVAVTILGTGLVAADGLVEVMLTASRARP